MKIKYLVLFLVMVSACGNQNEKSDAYGNFEAEDVIVSSQANGQILLFNIQEGETLNANQVVGLVDTISLYLQKVQLISRKSAIASSIGNVNSQIQVQLQQKKNVLVDQERLVRLFSEGAATQKQLDDINGALELIEKQINATKTQLNAITDEIKATDAQIERINENIRKSNIVNPISGTVLTKIAMQGEVTAFGKPLYRIANLDKLILKAYISGEQLAQVKTGQDVEVLIDINEKENRSLTGRVAWISDEAEFTPKTIQTKKERVHLVYAIKVAVKNDGSLKVGMPGEVNFNNQ